MDMLHPYASWAAWLYQFQGSKVGAIQSYEGRYKGRALNIPYVSRRWAVQGVQKANPKNPSQIRGVTATGT